MKKGNVLNNEQKITAVNSIGCGGSANIINCRCK